MDRRTERDLIERALTGDRAAAGDLIRGHQASVYAYLLRMSGRPYLAEDIAQEAFVRVLNNLHRFDFRYRFSTWLFTIARRLYLNAVQKHRPVYDSEIVSLSAGAASTDEMFDGDEERRVRHDMLQESLMDLSPVQREIIVLFHQLDWSIALIARHLDMPQGTVKSHLHRGRGKLRRLLSARPGYAERLDLVSLGLNVGPSADGGEDPG